MTAPSSWFTHRPARTLDLHAPAIDPTKVSVVIPVKDNQKGIDELLTSIKKLSVLPKEIIVVDNLSDPPIRAEFCQSDTRLLSCKIPGPAAARNLGARYATGDWVWFLDSDCLVERSTLTEFASNPAGAIGTCGRIVSRETKLLSRYYSEQEILMPQFAEEDEPLYLITASAIIYKSAFFEVGGFDESFPAAAGEDIDLGLRLFQRGRLSFSSRARVLHTFEENLDLFRTRFTRYGAGSRILAEKYKISLAPAPFAPNRPSLLARILAKLQYESLHIGYHNISAKAVVA